MTSVVFSIVCLVAFTAGTNAQSTNYNFVCTFVDNLACDLAASNTPVCTTDGSVFPSECFFTKAHCKDVTLTPVDCKSTNPPQATATTKITTTAVTDTTAAATIGLITPVTTAGPSVVTDTTSGDQLTNTTAPATTPTTTRNVDIVCQALLSNPCPSDNSSVCASNLVSYDSLCEYTKARCLDPSLTVLASGSCGSITTPAPNVAFIVCNVLAASTCYDDGVVLCGSDNITYGNSCLFEKAKCQKSALTVQNVGTCSQ